MKRKKIIKKKLNLFVSYLVFSFLQIGNVVICLFLSFFYGRLQNNLTAFMALTSWAILLLVINPIWWEIMEKL